MSTFGSLKKECRKHSEDGAVIVVTGGCAPNEAKHGAADASSDEIMERVWMG
jgi:hypothetical protein